MKWISWPHTFLATRPFLCSSLEQRLCLYFSFYPLILHSLTQPHFQPGFCPYQPTEWLLRGSVVTALSSDPVVSSLSVSCSPSAVLAIDHCFLHRHIFSRLYGTTVFSYTGCPPTCVATFHSPCTGIIYLYIWLCWVSVGSMQTLSCSMWGLVPWLGIEPRPPALGPWSLSHRTTREVPSQLFKTFLL